MDTTTQMPEINFQDKNGENALHQLAKSFFSRQLLEEFFTKYDTSDRFTQDKMGRTPLHTAVFSEQIDFIELAIKYGANVDITGNLDEFSISKQNCMTPLHLACRLGKTNVVKVLIELGANDKLKDAYGYTPAHHIVRPVAYAFPVNPHQRFESLKLLTNVNELDEKGNTPLMHIFPSHNSRSDINMSEICELLLIKGANPNIANDEGRTPIMTTTRWADSVKSLIDFGAEVNTQDNDGNTALHFTLYRGSENVARLLLAKGASAYIKNNNGQTPLDIATQKGYNDFLQLIL